MKINTKKISAIILAGFIMGLPFVAVAAEHLVPCDDDCDFNQLMAMANNIVRFLMYAVAVPLAALGFVVVGARLVFNQDKADAWTKAKEGFWDIGKGFFIIFGAFLLIKFILYEFLNTDAGFTLFLIQ